MVVSNKVSRIHDQDKWRMLCASSAHCDFFQFVKGTYPLRQLYPIDEWGMRAHAQYLTMGNYLWDP